MSLKPIHRELLYFNWRDLKKKHDSMLETHYLPHLHEFKIILKQCCCLENGLPQQPALLPQWHTYSFCVGVQPANLPLTMTFLPTCNVDEGELGSVFLNLSADLKQGKRKKDSTCLQRDGGRVTSLALLALFQYPLTLQGNIWHPQLFQDCVRALFEFMC